MKAGWLDQLHHESWRTKVTPTQNGRVGGVEVQSPEDRRRGADTASKVWGGRPTVEPNRIDLPHGRLFNLQLSELDRMTIIHGKIHGKIQSHSSDF